jgi:glycosyltransferase A (GT-A) superfamily protein (DUF2064 family)
MTSLPDTGRSPAADPLPPARTVAVLLDAPRPEFLPPGLTEAVGERHAIRLVRVIARRTLDNIARLGWTPVVWFRPADALPEMQRWLGASSVMHARDSGPLGETLGLLADATGEEESWLAVRPAGAGVPAELLLRADEAVRTGGLVFGATTHEDIYLIGGSGGLAGLVRSLPWGERDLAPTLRARLRDAGAGWAELPRLVDVTTADEARAVGLIL